MNNLTGWAAAIHEAAQPKVIRLPLPKPYNEYEKEKAKESKKKNK